MTSRKNGDCIFDQQKLNLHRAKLTLTCPLEQPLLCSGEEISVLQNHDLLAHVDTQNVAEYDCSNLVHRNK